MTGRPGCGSRILTTGSTIIFAALVFLGAGGWFFHRAVTTPYKGYAGASKVVEVPHGFASNKILEKLRDEGILRDDFFPLIYLKIFRRGESMKAGPYRFEGEVSPVAVIDKLIAGQVVLKSVTVREGLDRFALGLVMSDAGFGQPDEWNRLTGDATLINDLAPDADSLEGYLFPDTYSLAPGTTPETIVRTMVENFRKQFGGELAFIGTGLDIHQTVTLASIVETEAQRAEERPLIAGVYLNRIRRGMLLQADPTVIYALKLAGTWNGNIRKVDLQVDSPYNTYRYAGLPPGPIASPGLASLRAASNPAKTDFLYFVSKNDGSHVFAATLAQHNRNVTEYQRRYWRRQRQNRNGS